MSAHAIFLALVGLGFGYLSLEFGARGYVPVSLAEIGLLLSASLGMTGLLLIDAGS